MPSPLHHLADLARFAVTRPSRERDDQQALDELTGPLDLPAGLELEWLGTAGYRLSYQGHTVLIDPYFSRVPFSSVIKRTRTLPDGAALDRHLRVDGELDGVLIGHTHFDHAIDVPEIVRRHGSTAYGSRSLVHLMALHGLTDRAVQVEPHRTYELGPFTVTFVPSLHSKLILGVRVPYDGELTCEHLDALAPSAYRCGDVYGIHIEVAGTTFYHQGSANLLDDAIRHRGVDVFLAGVAGRSVTEDYWPRILTRLEPRVVVPNHYDDFFRPLSNPMGFATNVNLAAVPEEVGAVSGDIAVTALPLDADADIDS